MSHTCAEPELFTTGDLARLTGNTLRTVRYYEEMGLLQPIPRESGGHRLFTRADLSRLQTITDLRAVGLSLDEVAGVMRLKVHSAGTSEHLEHAKHVLDEQLVTVQDRIHTLLRVQAELTAARDLLESCRVCPRVGNPGACPNCEHAQAAEPHPLVGLMLADPTADPD